MARTRIDRFLMSAVRLVAVLDAEVAPGAFQDGDAFGHGPQVGEVVGPQAADVGL
jgi:hypothetical protein